VLFRSTDKLKKELDENEEKVIKSLLGNGYDTKGKSDNEFVTDLIEDNKDLSERETFRAEALIRATLLQGAILNATTASEAITKETVTPKGKLRPGDTLSVAERLRVDENLTNAQQLDSLIKTLMDEVNKIFDITLPDSTDTDTSETLESVMLSRKELNRLTELTKKDLDDVLTEEETTELDNLKDKFDRWTVLDGVVVDGVRLSDLIRRKVAYEKLSVDAVDDVFNLEGFESIDIPEFSSRTSEKHYDILQSYTLATVVKEDDGVSIQGLTLGGLALEMGGTASQEKLEMGEEGTVTLPDGTVIAVKTNARGNIILTEEDIVTINENSPLILKPTNKELTTRYSVLIRRNQDGTIEPVASNYAFHAEKDTDTEDNLETMDQEAIYGLNQNDPLRVVVDPLDDYNAELLRDSTAMSAPNEKAIKDELQKRLEANEDYIDAIEIRESKKVGSKEYKQLTAEIESITNSTSIDVMNELALDSIELKDDKVQELVDKMVIKLYDQNGSLVGVMKANRLGNKAPNDLIFELVRVNIVQESIGRILGDTTNPVDMSDIGITVADVFLGHPNYNFKEEGAELGTEFKKITEREAESIIDVGYMEKGKLILNNDTKDVDTTYVGKFKKEEGVKRPIIIMDYRGKKVDFPVNIKNRDNSEILKELEDTMYSNLDNTTKGIKVDGLLAELGINPNERGNSLEHFSADNNNFNEDNYELLLAKAKEKEYIYNPLSWKTSGREVKDIAMNELQINIDMNNPFHAPKIKVNYPKLDIPADLLNRDTDKKKTKTKKTKSKSVPTTDQGDLASKILNNLCK